MSTQPGQGTTTDIFHQTGESGSLSGGPYRTWERGHLQEEWPIPQHHSLCPLYTPDGRVQPSSVHMYPRRAADAVDDSALFLAPPKIRCRGGAGSLRAAGWLEFQDKRPFFHEGTLADLTSDSFSDGDSWPYYTPCVLHSTSCPQFSVSQRWVLDRTSGSSHGCCGCWSARMLIVSVMF